MEALAQPQDSEEESQGARRENESSQVGQRSRPRRRIGLIGHGHLAHFLRVELDKSEEFELRRMWNRTEDAEQGVLPLGELNAAQLADLDLVLEVAHPEVVRHYAKTILQHTDLFIGSPSALANLSTYKQIQESLRTQPQRSVFIPAGALWGAGDIRSMADLSILKTLRMTLLIPPAALRLPDSTPESSPELLVLQRLCEEAKLSNQPKVLYDGPIRQICQLVPSNANALASAAVAAHNLGFDNARAKLIVDPALRNWHILECEVGGENGFRTVVRRENQTQPGLVTGDSAFFAFLASVRESLYKSPGLNIC